MDDHHKEHHKRLKAGTVEKRAKRKHQLDQEHPSVIPWRLITKLAVAAVVVAIGTGVYYYLSTRPDPPLPIEWDRCPTVAECVGTIDAERNGEAVSIVQGERIPPGTRLLPKQGGTMKLTFADGSIISLYPGSQVVTDTDYRPRVTLEAGPLYVDAKTQIVRVDTTYGHAECLDAVVHLEVARSRFRADCERGQVILTNVQLNRKLRVRKTLPGEVGIGADALGIQASEAVEALTYPDLEVTKVALINADKNTGYPSFNPMRDGAVFVQNELSPKRFDFQVMTNSPNTVKLVVMIWKMTDEGITELHNHATKPVTVKGQLVFGAFGAEATPDGDVAFTGGELPPGDYLMALTPHGPIRDGKPGKGRGVALRFCMVK